MSSGVCCMKTLLLLLRFSTEWHPSRPSAALNSRPWQTADSCLSKMTNRGSFAPLGLEIQIESCVWWTGHQQRVGNVRKSEICAGAEFLRSIGKRVVGWGPPRPASREWGHDFTSMHSVQSLQVFVWLDSLHLSGLRSKTEGVLLCQKTGFINAPSVGRGRQQETVTHCTRERCKMCSNLTGVWQRGEEVKKQAGCAMWVKLTLALPGGPGPCCLWQRGEGHKGWEGKTSWW